LFNGKDQSKTFNVKASSSGDSGFSTGLIVIILIAVIAILAVAVVVISRRNNDGDFDELYDDEDDKSYASIPATQSYSAPAAQVSPEMAEAIEKFTFWTQEEIQAYFDQGWSIQQLEEWLENQ
jgi:flagellar basal body-associated protein FliL